MSEDKTTLPPLPECDAYCGDCNQGESMWTEEQMIAYAEMAVKQEREACAKVCDTTPPYPFRPSIEAAHAIRSRGKE